MKIVIIEDEILTAEDLRHNLQSLNYGIEITAILPTVTQSIEYFSTNVLVVFAGIYVSAL